MVAAKKFKGNYHAALDFLASYEGFYRLDKGVFSIRLHRLKTVIELIFKHLSHTIKSLNVSKNYIIDTFPVAGCRNIRIKNCRLLTGENYRGFNNSKKEWFYGFKIQIITTEDGTPVQFDVFCGETGDVTAFQCTQINLEAGSSLYGDKAYNDYDQEDLLRQCEQIYFKSHRKVIPKEKTCLFRYFLKTTSENKPKIHL